MAHKQQQSPAQHEFQCMACGNGFHASLEDRADLCAKCERKSTVSPPEDKQPPTHANAVHLSVIRELCGHVIVCGLGDYDCEDCALYTEAVEAVDMEKRSRILRSSATPHVHVQYLRTLAEGLNKADYVMICGGQDISSSTMDMLRDCATHLEALIEGRIYNG